MLNNGVAFEIKRFIATKTRLRTGCPHCGFARTGKHDSDCAFRALGPMTMLKDVISCAVIRNKNRPVRWGKCAGVAYEISLFILLVFFVVLFLWPTL